VILAISTTATLTTTNLLNWFTSSFTFFVS
jgi:hypothetical protein